MARKVNLPVLKIQAFLDAAVPWLRKCMDYRNGLELCLVAIEANKLHMSVGGTAHYIEAVTEHPDVSNLAKPLFLDLDFLTRYKFKEETMQITIPDKVDRDTEKRVQFRGQNVSFKIPLRNGEKWDTHQQKDKNIDDIAGFVLTGGFLAEHYKRLLLPNSFSDKDPRALQIVTTDTGNVMMYSNDSYGAFCHTFPDTNIFATGDTAGVRILYDFLLPYKGITKNEKVQMLELRQDKNQNYASIQTEEGLFERFVWIQPLSPKPIDDVPTALREARKGVDWAMEFDTAQLYQKLQEVTSFYSETNYRENPVSFAIVGDQYTLSTTLPNSDMNVQGKTTQAAPESVRARFQAGCLLDYLSCLEHKQHTHIELLRNTAILYQQVPEDTNLCYWMPIQER